MTNVIFESYLHNIHLESNLIFRPVSPAGNYVKHETLKLKSLATTSKDMNVR